jgi:hypothetical protein
LLTLLIAAVVLGGLGYLIGLRFARELPSLIEQLVGTVRRLRAGWAEVAVAWVSSNSTSSKER